MLHDKCISWPCNCCHHGRCILGCVQRRQPQLHAAAVDGRTKRELAAVHDDRNHSLIDISSCGLHVVHNAFKAGFEATGWDVKSFLWALYTIFYETPARHEDYTAITSSVVFPLKFCVHRWVENATVAARALIILPHLKKYVDTIQQNPKTYAVPTSKSFTIVKSGCTDVLMPAWLMFFESVAHQFESFLVR